MGHLGSSGMDKGGKTSCGPVAIPVAIPSLDAKPFKERL